MSSEANMEAWIAGFGGDGVQHSHPSPAGVHPPVLWAQGCGRGCLHGVGQDAGIRHPNPGKAEQARDATAQESGDDLMPFFGSQGHGFSFFPCAWSHLGKEYSQQSIKRTSSGTISPTNDGVVRQP